MSSGRAFRFVVISVLVTLILISDLRVSLCNHHAIQFAERTTNASVAESLPEQSPNQCYAYAVLAQYKSDATSIAQSLPPQVGTPSKHKPFFYFHLRKAGGSTLRNLIGQAADSYNLTHWIPCYHRPCMPFSIPPGEALHEVYASHLEYHTAVAMLREVDFHATSSSNLEQLRLPRSDIPNATIHLAQYVGDPPHTCMTRLRPTVDRVTSCWNFRGVQNGDPNNPVAHDIHANDWQQILDSVDCSNEIVRMFGSVADLSYVRKASPCDSIAEIEFEQILRRMSTCIMTHNDRCEESKEIVDTFFPWLSGAYKCEARTNVGKIRPKPLDPAASAIILKANEYDDLLYQFGEALFEAQLQQAREIQRRKSAD